MTDRLQLLLRRRKRHRLARFLPFPHALSDRSTRPSHNLASLHSLQCFYWLFVGIEECFLSAFVRDCFMFWFNSRVSPVFPAVLFAFTHCPSLQLLFIRCVLLFLLHCCASPPRFLSSVFVALWCGDWVILLFVLHWFPSFNNALFFALQTLNHSRQLYQHFCHPFSVVSGGAIHRVRHRFLLQAFTWCSRSCLHMFDGAKVKEWTMHCLLMPKISHVHCSCLSFVF